MKVFHASNLARTVVICLFAIMLIFPAVADLYASVQIGPDPNPAGNVIETPLDLNNPPVVTAHNNIDFTNNGTVDLYGSFTNSGTFTNNGRMADVIQFIQFNNNAGAVFTINSGALYKKGNGTFWNNAGATTKDIAGLLHTSKVAIDNHRYNIRKKLGINNKKENLRSFFLSIA